MKRLRSLMLSGLVLGATLSLAIAQDDSEAAAPNGAEQYQLFCAACHMSDGSGADGAGRYPNLTGNPAVEASPVFVVVRILNGYGAMPWFASLSVENIAAIVNHVRNAFQNADEQVGPAVVEAQRLSDQLCVRVQCTQVDKQTALPPPSARCVRASRVV